MKKVFCAFVALALLMALPLLADQAKLGKPITIKTTTSVKSILSEPEKFLGKDVRVEGEITKVCQMQGCWILLKDASSSEPIMVKVEDGVIIFPKDGVGKKVAVEGKLEKVSDEAQQEAGVKSEYRIKGSGAELK